MKNIAYLGILTSVIGASVISIDLGFFQLSLFRILILFMATLTILQMLKTNEKFKIRSTNDMNHSVKIFIFWFLYSIISLAWVFDYVAWIRSVYFIGLGALTIIIFSRLLKKTSDIITAFKLIALMSIFHNLIGWFEVNTGKYLFLSADRILLYSKNNYPVSMFGNTNDFATFMLFSVFILFICFTVSKKLISKIVYMTSMFSSSYLILLTSSRANILGLIIGVAFLIYFSLRNKRVRFIMVSFLMLLFSFVLIYPNMVQDFINNTMGNLKFNFDTTNSEVVRINLIKNGFLFLIQTFGFGTGAGNIEYWMENRGVYYTADVVNIHNWWLEILTGYGVLVFTLYILFYFKLFKSLFRTFRISKEKEDITISLSVMCCMIGFVFGAISSSSNISAEWLWVFWAIVIAYQGIVSRKILTA